MMTNNRYIGGMDKEEKRNPSHRNNFLGKRKKGKKIEKMMITERGGSSEAAKWVSCKPNLWG